MKEIYKGAIECAAKIGSTLGPKGRNVIIEKRNMPPQITKDGVTVAREYYTDNKMEAMGAKSILEAAAKANDLAGDGTTTCSILVSSILTKGLKLIEAGHHPISLKRGIDIAVKQVVENLLKQARPVDVNSENVRSVASISGNNDPEIGNAIYDAICAVGEGGAITIKTGAEKTHVEMQSGMQWNRGYIEPDFINVAKTLSSEYNDVRVLVFSDKLTSFNDIAHLWEFVAPNTPLLIVAEDVSGEALDLLRAYHTKGKFTVLPVVGPWVADKRKEALRDIAAVTGSTLFTKSEDLRVAIDADLGYAENVKSTHKSTVITGGRKNEKEMELIISEIENKMELTKSNTDLTTLQERRGRITGGVAVIHIGANNDVEMKEKEDRFDDALNATNAAIEEGIVIGGGCALLNSSKSLSTDINGEELVGFNLIKEAIKAPFYKICENAAVNGEVKEQGCSGWTGYDAKNDEHVDMFKAGIIDPVKVTRVALESAASVAGLLLLTDNYIVKDFSKEQLF